MEGDPALVKNVARKHYSPALVSVHLRVSALEAALETKAQDRGSFAKWSCATVEPCGFRSILQSMRVHLGLSAQMDSHIRTLGCKDMLQACSRWGKTLCMQKSMDEVIASMVGGRLRLKLVDKGQGQWVGLAAL